MEFFVKIFYHFLNLFLTLKAKYQVPLPKVKAVSDAEAFKVVSTGKNFEMANISKYWQEVSLAV